MILNNLVPKHHNEFARRSVHCPTVLSVQNLVNLCAWPNGELVHVIELVEYETSHRPVSDMWAQRLDESSEIQRINVRWCECYISFDNERTNGITCVFTTQVRVEFVLTLRQIHRVRKSLRTLRTLDRNHPYQ